MFHGNLAQALRSIGQLEQTLAELDVMPRKLAIDVAPKITRLLQRQFSRGTNPYGRRWAKLASGKPSHLTETGRLRDGTRAGPMPGGRAGVRVILGARYGYFHQTGTRHMPARRILPQMGMPADWREVFDASARKLAARARRRVR